MSHSIVRKLLGMGVVVLFALTAPPLAWSTLGAGGQSAPPSLAELARKEAERRKTSKTKDTKKVITTKDMPESARRPAGANGAAPTDPAAGAASPGSPASTDQKPAAGAATVPADDKAEASWRNRMTQAREALRRNEVFLQALQTRVNSLTVDYANANANQQIQVRENQTKALEEMERVKADIEQSKKQIGDIEEEARRAGVPPGWVR